MSTKSPDRRVTVMVVPALGDGGRVRQWNVSVRHLRAVVATGTLAGVGLIVAAIAQVRTLPMVRDHDRLVAENAALREQVAQNDQRLAELEPVIERVRAYDEMLRTLSGRGAVPGTGPLDEEELAERDAWIAGVVEAPNGEPSLASLDALATALDTIDLDGLGVAIERWETLSSAMPQVSPVEGTLTSSFGYRRSPFGKTTWKFHGGLDLAAPYGATIVASNDGLVTFSGWDSGHGRTIDLDHGSGVSSRYCHASRLLVEEGQEVLAGQPIALVGSSGMSTGPHLHYELYIDGQRVDPLPYLPD